MTVLEALRLNVDENANVVIPVGACRGEIDIPGTVTEETLRSLFGVQLDQTVPLSEEAFATLKDTVVGNWQDNWQLWRDQGTI